MTLNKELFKNPEEKIDFSIAIVVILFFGFLMFFFLRGDFSQQANSNNSIEVFEPEYKDVEKKILVVEGKDFEVQEVIEESLESNKKLEEPYINSVAIIDSSVIEEEVRNTEIKIAPSNSESVTRIETPLNKEEIKDSIIQDTETTEINTPEVVENQNLNTNSNLQKECIIWVGRFALLENAKKITEVLISDQYKVFQEEKNGLLAVGIYINCNEDEASKVLKRIKEKFNIDAIFAKEI